MKVVTLKTEAFPRPHTAYAVSEKIYESLKELKLVSKNICAVTDGGSNIVAALKLRNINRFGCIAHILHRFLSHDEQAELAKIILDAEQVLESLDTEENFSNGDENFNLTSKHTSLKNLFQRDVTLS
ncbi:hypothetical protein FF38_09063 [Lucilia cuprina]|uniref:Uncharacterized protein n=1 Tax=Lucilia cuprina TaxID=7375 RepID=A0A0L0BVB6_LUCCU|nr:hypothetical protein FF38_09063 [Lucilia cuprina]